MKKKTFILTFFMMFCSLVFGQNTGWGDVNPYQYPGSMTAVTYISIDDVIQTATNLELGAFCGDEMRGKASLKKVVGQDGNERHLAYITIYGNADGETISFKLYNKTSTKVIFPSADATITFVDNGVVGSTANPTTINFSSAAQIGSVKYPTLADAFAAATEGQTVEMLRDVTEEFAINNSANVTFDMKDFTLTGAILPSTANLTVKNGTIVNNNTSYSAIEITSGSIVLNEDVKVSSVRHAIRIDGAVAATIKGGEYTLIPKSGRTHHALNVSGAANVTIEGGKFVGPKGTASDSGSAIKVQTGATVAISGGEFSGGKTKTLSSDGTLSLTGGRYDQDVKAFCAEGYMTVKGTDGWYTVVKAIAKIEQTGKIYATLSEAFAAATEGQTVVMLSNAEEVVNINKEAAVTLNMAGFTLTGSILAPSANLTVTNGTINNTNKNVSAIEINAGTLTLESTVTVNSARHALRIDGSVTATINGGTYKSAQGTGTGTYHAANISGAANVTIKGGTFVGPKGTTADSGAAVNVQSGAAVTIEGGEFSGGKRNTLASSGTLSLTGGKYDQDVQKYCAAGYMAVKNGEWYEVVEAAAKIVETGKIYPTLADAFAAATEGQTVEMLRDVTEEFAISNDANVTFNMAGKTLTGAILPSAANLTVTNGTIVNNNTSYSAIEINSGSIVLNEDVKVSSVRHAIRIDGAVAATIKGGEYTLIPKSGRTHHALNVSGAANVTIEGGKFVGPKGTASDSGSAIKVQTGATVAISGGEFSGGKTKTLSSDGTLSLTGGKYDQDVQKYCAAGYMTVKNGEWYEVVEAAAKIVETGVYYTTFDEAYTAAKTGETIELFRTAIVKKNFTTYSKPITVKANFGATAFRVQGNAMMVTFNEMTIESNDYCITVGASDGSSDAMVNIQGGIYKGSTTAISVTKGIVNIFEGTFEVEPYQGSYEYTINCIDANYNATPRLADVSIKGGKFYNFNPQNNAAEGPGTNFVTGGYATAKDADNYWHVGAIVAKIGETPYLSLADAVEAAQDGETITLAYTAGFYNGAGVVINKNITIDFNGKKYVVNETVGSSGTETLGFQILKGNNVTLKNGTLTSKKAIEGSNEVKMLVQNYANLTLTDMNLVDDTDHILYVLSNNSGTVNINGKTNITTDKVAFDVCKYASYAAPIVNVNTTGIIDGKIEVTAEINSNLNISGGYFTVEIQEAWCADGYIPTTVDLNGTTYYTVEEGNFVARNTTTGQKYATLQAAVDAANAGDTIELLKDITLEGGYANDTEAGLGIVLPGNVGDTGNEKGLTIDGNGFTIDCGDFTKGIRIYNYISGRPSIVTFNNVTIENKQANGRCIDTRSGNINLKINNTDLIATKGNSQPLTIGGTEKIHRVSLGNNTTIDAGNSGYGVICFVSTNVDVITSGSTKINGYAAFYIHGDALDVQLDLGQGTYTGKNIHSGESNAFGTIVLEGDNTMVKMIGTNPTINAIAEGTATQAAFLVLGENNTISIESQTAKIEPQGENAYWAMIDAEVAKTTIIKDNGTPLLPAAEADGFQFMSLEEAIRYAKNNTVKVVNNNTVAAPIIVEKDLTLNLNGKAITATENVYPVVRIQNDANVTVTGAGSITNETDYVFVLGSSDKATAGNLTIKNGTYVGATTVASVTKGALAIEGGDFSLVEGTTDYRYLINCIDANYNDNSANVAITGGTFHNWNPENNAAEGSGTNFCAPGYTALETSTNVWTVVVGLRRTLEQGWSWFSSYIDIDGTTGFEKLQNALGTSGLQIKGQLGFVDYNSEWGWNGNLETTSVKEMYMIQTSEQVELVLTGELADPATKITLQNGWTYIGYPVATAMNIEDALDGITPNDGDIIKTHYGSAMYYKDLEGQDGQLWSGWWGEKLQSMTPGMGYMYKNNGAKQTLVYPTPNAKAEVRANVTSENNHWAPKASAFANNMNIIAVLESNDMMGEFEVAAFVNGEVRGSARPTYVEPIDAYVLLMTIYGEEGEELTFKYYDIYSDEEHNISNTVNYSDDAVIGSIREPYMFFANTLGMDENAANTLSLYPNPTTTNTAISFETTFDMVEVFNSLGAKVAEYRNVDRIEGMEAAGVYVIRVTNDSTVQNCRLIVK